MAPTSLLVQKTCLISCFSSLGNLIGKATISCTKDAIPRATFFPWWFPQMKRWKKVHLGKAVGEEDGCCWGKLFLNSKFIAYIIDFNHCITSLHQKTKHPIKFHGVKTNPYMATPWFLVFCCLQTTLAMHALVANFHQILAWRIWFWAYAKDLSCKKKWPKFERFQDYK